jgi:hypothetical protein
LRAIASPTGGSAPGCSALQGEHATISRTDGRSCSRSAQGSLLFDRMPVVSVPVPVSRSDCCASLDYQGKGGCDDDDDECDVEAEAATHQQRSNSCSSVRLNPVSHSSCLLVLLSSADANWAPTLTYAKRPPELSSYLTSSVATTTPSTSHRTLAAAELGRSPPISRAATARRIQRPRRSNQTTKRVLQFVLRSRYIARSN